MNSADTPVRQWTMGTGTYMRFTSRIFSIRKFICSWRLYFLMFAMWKKKSSLRSSTSSSPYSPPRWILVPASRCRGCYARKTKTTNFEVNIQDRTYIGKVLWNKTWNGPRARGVELCFGFSLKICRHVCSYTLSYSYCKSKHHMLPSYPHAGLLYLGFET